MKAIYDGKWVLRTNADIDTNGMVKVYRDLWKVEGHSGIWGMYGG